MRLLRLFKDFFKDIFSGRKLLFSLAKNDFRAKYAGSFFGVVWAFVLPLVTIFVFWFVFEVGFRNPPINDYPYILWLIPAFLAWNFFSDTLINSTNAFYDFAFLVKKIKFNIGILPMVKIMSGWFVHAFFIGFIILMYGFYGIAPSVSNLQAFYYMFCMLVLMVAISYFTSSLAVFFKDMGNVVGVIMQVGFWATPIIWNPMDMSEKAISILEYNPMYYVAVGYRDAFMNTGWFFEKPGLTLYFWVFTAILLVIGIFVYQRTKAHFADVL